MIKTFAGCEVRYETLIDHNAYEYLRVTIDVPRNQKEKAIVLLRGKEVGELNLIGNKILAIRYGKKNKKKVGTFEDVGLATASIITDLL
jgi:hypothetical protein